MTRLETLRKLALDELDKPYSWKPINGVGLMDLAKAVDKLNEAETVLRTAFPERERSER